MRKLLKFDKVAGTRLVARNRMAQALPFLQQVLSNQSLIEQLAKAGKTINEFELSQIVQSVKKPIGIMICSVFLLPLMGCHNIFLVNVGGETKQASTIDSRLAPELKCMALATQETTDACLKAMREKRRNTSKK